MTELRWLSAVEAARAIREGVVSPVELARALLDAIAELNGAIVAFSAVMPERVLAEARRAERAVANGEPLGPLHGVPFAVKDMLSVAGYPITHGSHLLGDASADRDAASVARLRAAGGLVLGITAMAEFGHKGFNDSPRYGVTRNPWDRTRTAGGSSGGTAAALAAGLAPAGLGTDVGGSIRIPAACCGIVGLKPTLGAVPYDDGVDAFAGMMHVGPMARSVGDVALLQSVIAGPHPSDPWSYAAAPGTDILRALDPDASVQDFRIGWAPTIGNPGVEADVRAACEEALASLEKAGAVVEPFEIDLSSSADVLFTMAPVSLYALYGERLASEGHRLDPSARLAIEGGERITGLALQRAQMERTRLFRLVQDCFARFDVLAMPTLAATARSADHGAFEPLSVAGAKPAGPRFSWYPYTHAFNATGHPAISVPAGFGTGGLPVGLQLVGPWAGEARLLRIAAALETLHPWRQYRPRIEALLLQTELAT